MIVSPYLESIQQSHQFQGSSNDCGPFCAAILINSKNSTNLTGQELAVKMNRILWKGGMPRIRRVRNWATFPWGVADILREEGFPARWRMGITIRELFDGLSGSDIYIVIIGEYRPLWSHYKILVAHHSLKGWGFVNPAKQNADIQWDQHASFLDYWSKYGRQVVQVSAV